MCNEVKGRGVGIKIGMKAVKLSLFVDDMVVYIENSKDLYYKPSELISKFSRNSGYQNNM